MNPEDILQTIRKNEIKPISKNIFIIKRVTSWAIALIATLAGAFAIAKIITSIILASWEYWDYSFDTIGSFIFSTLPILWIIFLVTFIFCMPYIVHKTKNGYKYKGAIIVLSSIVISFILAIFILKVGSYTNTNGIFINPLISSEIRTWSNPNGGRLSGYVDVHTNSTMIIRDFSGVIWIVDISNLLPGSKDVIVDNGVVRIVGLKTDDNVFLACQVLPFDINTKLIDTKTILTNETITTPVTPAITDVCSAVLGQSL